MRIYALEGYTFFGTAHRLVQQLEAALDAAPRPTHLLIDFRSVRGLDVSAARAIAGVGELCRSRGTALAFTGLHPAAERQMRSQRHGAARFLPRLEQGLEQVEGELLADAAAAHRALVGRQTVGKTVLVPGA